MKVTDYRDFCTIDTPKEERDRMNIGEIYQNSAICLRCGEEIVSKNRHDFVTCKCGAVSVDGGSYYCKRVFESPDCYKDTSIVFKDVEARR